MVGASFVIEHNIQKEKPGGRFGPPGKLFEVCPDSRAYQLTVANIITNDIIG